MIDETIFGGSPNNATKSPIYAVPPQVKIGVKVNPAKLDDMADNEQFALVFHPPIKS